MNNQYLTDFRYEEPSVHMSEDDQDNEHERSHNTFLPLRKESMS